MRFTMSRFNCRRLLHALIGSASLLGVTTLAPSALAQGRYGSQVQTTTQIVTTRYVAPATYDRAPRYGADRVDYRYNSRRGDRDSRRYSREPVRCEPVRCEPVRCEPVVVCRPVVVCEPVRCEPVRCEPVRCEPAPRYQRDYRPQIRSGFSLSAVFRF
jgi:hypothetical protein